MIAGFLVFVAVVMLTSWKPHPTREMPGRLLSAVIASIGGVISGLAGIGGGNVIVPTLVFFNTPIHRATATSSALGLGIALFGAAGYMIAGRHSDIPDSIGYVYLPALLPLVVASVLFAPLGVRAAHKIAAAPLRKAFGVLLLFVAARMIYSSL